MKWRLRHYKDDGAIHIAIIAVIVIVLIVVGAVVVYAVMWPSDKTDGGVSDGDAVAELVITCKIGDFDNQVGSVEVRDVKFKVEDQPFDAGGFFDALNIDWEPANWFYFGGEFKVTLKLEIKGPNDFIEDGLFDNQKIQMDEWEDWGDQSISFKTMRCRVSENGDYYVYAEIIVDSDNEGVENEVCWTQTKKVTVEGY